MSFLKNNLFLKIFYLFIFREKGREGETEGEKHQSATFPTPPTRVQARNPGMYADLESNWRPFGLQAGWLSVP